MSKKLTDFKNPLTMSGGSIFDWSVWTGGILFVVVVGMIMAMGAKALTIVDGKFPGNQTPNVAPYTQPSTGSGLNVL